MKNTFFFFLFFLTTLVFAGKKYEDQVIERITCPTQKCEEGQTLDIEMIGISKFFKFNVSSKDVSANKPSANHFDKAQELLDINKNQILHVGDHQINDMYGAINYGLSALWFNPNRQIWDLRDTEKPSEFASWKGITEKINSL